MSMKIYSFIEAQGHTFRPAPRHGSGEPTAIHVATIDGRHYMAVRGPVPAQSPAIDLRGPIDLEREPQLRAELDRRAEPLRIVRRQRAEAYPEIGEQLDAIIKEFAARRAAGETLTPALARIVEACLAVKERHPKPNVGLP